MRRTRWPLIALMLTAPLPVGCRAGEGTIVERARQVYEREGCPMCHSIAGKGNRRNPLDGVGSRLSREEIRKWIVSPQEMKPGVKKKNYELSEPDLEALIAYLHRLTE